MLPQKELEKKEPEVPKNFEDAIFDKLKNAKFPPL
jgi:hypothetical protein